MTNNNRDKDNSDKNFTSVLNKLDVSFEDHTQEEFPSWLTRATDFRLNMPEEQAQPWLSFLLDAYAIVDASIDDAIELAKSNNNKHICEEGCVHCCFQTIPITPVEAMGIRYAINKLLPRIEREAIQKQLLEQEGNKEWNKGQCPFLLENRCSIYPLRPIPCRRYLVLNTRCLSPQEDVFTTRPKDILDSDRAALYAALAHTSPVYSSLGITEKGKVLSFDNFKQLFVDIREVDWLKN